MASEGGGSLDPLSTLISIIILSVLGYAAYGSIIRYLHEQKVPIPQALEPAADAPVLQPQY